DDTARFWDRATGRALGCVRLPPETLRGNYSVEFVADDRVLVLDLGYNDSIHRIFDVQTGKQVGDWELARGVSNLAVSPHGKRVASRWRDGVIRLHDALTGKVLREMQGDAPPHGLLCAYDTHPGRLAFSPDGTTLAVAALGQRYCGRAKA